MNEALLAEFDLEMGKTRRLMERLPEADLGWKPHDKSYSMGQLAAHLANLPTWIEPTCDLAVFDLATLDGIVRVEVEDQGHGEVRRVAHRLGRTRPERRPGA